MPTAKHILGFGLSTLGLTLGFLCLGRVASTALASEPQPNRQETMTAGLLLGVPATAGAIWMLKALEQDHTLVGSRRLQTLFYKVLRANEGRINAAQFALLAEVSLSEAKDCLDTWAAMLNADFDIDELGVTIYCFNV